MRNQSRPRQKNATSSASKFEAISTSVSGEAKPEAPEMFNILRALESARGLLKVQDVANLFHKSPFTIYRMAEKRQIPSLVVGGSRYFDPSVLALWLSKKEPALAVAARRFKAA